MKISKKNQKILDISLKALTWVLVAFTVFMMVFTLFTAMTVNKNDRSIFGYKFYIVKTDSMSPSELNAHLDVHFSAGDIIIIKNVEDAKTLESGDIIAFVSTNTDTYGETITHMIREPKRTENGELLGYVTFGTNTDTNDEAIVEPEYVLGQYAGKLPSVGKFFAYVKSTPGYIVCILIPFLLLILYNGANVIRLFQRYKKEQTAVMEAEKAQIELDRQRNEEMLRELMALKEQLEKQKDGNTPSSNGDDTLPK